MHNYNYACMSLQLDCFDLIKHQSIYACTSILFSITHHMMACMDSSTRSSVCSPGEYTYTDPQWLHVYISQYYALIMAGRA